MAELASGRGGEPRSRLKEKNGEDSLSSNGKVIELN